MTPQWLARRLTKPCTIARRVPSGFDEYGNEIYTDTTTDTLCFLQPQSSTEIMGGRAGLGTFLLHLPSDVASLADGFASYTVEGVEYEALGPAAIHSTLNGDLHHVELEVAVSTA